MPNKAIFYKQISEIPKFYFSTVHLVDNLALSFTCICTLEKILFRSINTRG
jgi:hypothetical protein